MPSFINEKMLEETVKKLESGSIFFANFSGLSVSDSETLRKELAKVAKHVFVVKNTLAKRALERVNASAASVFVEGAIVLVTTDDDPQPVSKALVNFAKDKEAFELKGAFLEGAAQNHEYVKALAALPSKDELITKVVCGIKSPITGFVLTLNAITKGFVVALNEIRKKKESS